MASHESNSDSSRTPQIEDAVSRFLGACGLDLSEKDFVGTPRRVAALWQQEFISGYQMDPAEILGDVVEGEGQTEWVVIQEIPCHGMCPHHLLPWTGKASVAYLPNQRLLGFGRLAKLVQCFTRRLTLQERATNDIVDALMSHLGAKGAACKIIAQHNCLNVPDDKHGTRVVTASYRGQAKECRDLSL